MRRNLRSAPVLLRVLSRHIIGVAVFAALFGITGLLISAFAIPERHEAHTLLYLEAYYNPDRPEDLNTLNDAQNMARNCIVLFKSDDLLQELIDRRDLGVTPAELSGSVDVSVVDRSTVLRLAVTASDSETALSLVTDYTGICIERFERLITAGSVRLGAPAAANPVPKHIAGFTLGGLCIGWFGSYCCFLAGELLDRKLKSADDLSVIYNLPVLAVIPLARGAEQNYLL